MTCYICPSETQTLVGMSYITVLLTQSASTFPQSGSGWLNHVPCPVTLSYHVPLHRSATRLGKLRSSPVQGPIFSSSTRGPPKVPRETRRKRPVSCGATEKYIKILQFKKLQILYRLVGTAQSALYKGRCLCVL